MHFQASDYAHKVLNNSVLIGNNFSIIHVLLNPHRPIYIGHYAYL